MSEFWKWFAGISVSVIAAFPIAWAAYLTYRGIKATAEKTAEAKAKEIAANLEIEKWKLKAAEGTQVNVAEQQAYAHEQSMIPLTSGMVKDLWTEIKSQKEEYRKEMDAERQRCLDELAEVQRKSDVEIAKLQTRCDMTDTRITKGRDDFHKTREEFGAAVEVLKDKSNTAIAVAQGTADKVMALEATVQAAVPAKVTEGNLVKVIEGPVEGIQ